MNLGPSGVRRRSRGYLIASVAAVMLNLAVTDVASAYVGASFLQIPGIAGGWQGEKYQDWIKAEAQYWEPSGGRSAGRPPAQPTKAGTARPVRNATAAGDFLGVSIAPTTGAGTMTVAVDKKNPVLPKLMEACAAHVKIPEMTYAEASGRTQTTPKGERPANLPEYFEYKLKDVSLDCPTLADAPEQAIVVKFDGIQWLNYEGRGEASVFEPKKLKPTTTSGTTKSYVVEWIAYANDVSDDQCPKMNEKPTEDDYYALLSKADAAKERTERGEKGVNYQNGEMERRGPKKLSVCKLPGIVPAVAHAEPQTKIARGINLDGDDGSGAVPSGTCKHPNFASADGKRSGIDNQLYRVMGCTPAYMGHKGFYFQYANEQRRNGMLAIMIEVSGIDDERNDDSVEVALLYSADPMAKDASGTKILPDYTFRVTDDPEFTHYFTQLHGKIVDGVITTEPADKILMNHGMDIEIEMFKAALRLDIQPDGSLKGVLGGYIDWRKRIATSLSSQSESLYGYQCPAIYQEYKRVADGLKDPITGECNGISAAYDVEAVPAFIPPAQRKSLISQADTSSVRR